MINGTLTPKFPLVLGHEASGAIAETGDWAAACRARWYRLQGGEGRHECPQWTVGRRHRGARAHERRRVRRGPELRRRGRLRRRDTEDPPTIGEPHD
ncbi:hypothetical protein [Prauserella sp. PE36]|uniref:hypothetical protein n=1 Tax=Prauserella sp. PE36 TaxID=1504709 RepID=UPI001F359975|nr:hypothetical protein [Prauserella sp. PE36]